MRGASSEYDPPRAAKNMSVFPLIYGFRELVAGAGFVAGVTVEGRALVKREEDGAWWVYGVEPGGVAAPGDTEHEAYVNFRDCLREVLADSGALCPTFEAFRADVEKLGHQVNDAWDAEWQAARAALLLIEMVQVFAPWAKIVPTTPTAAVVAADED